LSYKPVSVPVHDVAKVLRLRQIRWQLRARNNGHRDSLPTNQVRVLRREFVVVSDKNRPELELRKLDKQVNIALTFEHQLLNTRRVDESAFL
jgi:hypothetical protein